MLPRKDPEPESLLSRQSLTALLRLGDSDRVFRSFRQGFSA